MVDVLEGPCWGPASGGPARHVVLLLHGIGADGFDLIDLAPIWGRTVPDALFIAPHAPEPFDMAPHGRQWFSLRDRRHACMLTGIEGAASWLEPRIAATLDQFHLTRGDLVLMGFSQGAMLALHLGLFYTERCAAVLAYSGALLASGNLPSAPRPTPPILLMHGEADEVVPVSASREAEQALRDNKILVEANYAPGLGHGIDDLGLNRGATKLHAALHPEA